MLLVFNCIADLAAPPINIDNPKTMPPGLPPAANLPGKGDTATASTSAPTSDAHESHNSTRLDQFLHEQSKGEESSKKEESSKGADSAQPIQPATLPQEVNDRELDLPKPPPKDVSVETKHQYDLAVRAYYASWANNLAIPERKSSPVTLAKCDQSVQAYYDYETHGLQHRRYVFEFQYRTSIIIFVVVIILVLLGMYFSWMQFQTTLASIKRSQTSAVPTSGRVSEVTAIKPAEAEAIKPAEAEAPPGSKDASEITSEITTVKFSKRCSV